jgi:hypothetical protein
LGNERLAFLFLASLNSQSRSPSSSSSVSASTSTLTSPSGVSISPDVLLNLISSSQAAIDYCASQFHCYSVEEIGRLDKHTLHLLLESPSLRLESEDSLLQLLIELGSNYFEFWHYIEPVFLTSDGISLFGNTLPFDHVNSDIWKKVFDRLENKSNESIRIRRFSKSTPSVKHLESNILKDIPSILKDFETKTWTLLYRGTRDGFGSANFHSKCDQQSNTLTIILTTAGYVFGGFSPTAWDSSNSYKADNTGKSFLFSLKNARNSEPKIFPLSNPSYSICCHSSYGPIFGNGNDIYVLNNCDQSASSCTNLGVGYKNDTGIASQEVFTGESTFQVKEIEVFSISS